ncbi:GMC family oxidoreductase [Novosphingobium sp. KCTC 2891]|uniref:GMC family oxidoreductase n=1 Tax=Novosphingobium sp. KCTC 2891 TaxID=2989730 RepID=UPI002221D7E0|nr:GMC family oxidoreductase [Novosphingobium sp. KCTC 2891]MCW1384879.1 GMC family oxidoreductase [Novosphingobium sp. KCTC 2891]
MNRAEDPDGTIADVLIVGAGPAGGMAAKHLVAAGLSVVCLEQGDWESSDRLPTGRPEGELMARQRWHWSPNQREREADYPIDESESDVGITMYNAVGGSTWLWGAHWHRLTPSDFAVRSLDGVADDWPITYAELEPFYEEAELAMGVSGLSGDPAYPAPHRHPLPPFPIGKAGRKAAEGMNRLGWHWWPGSNGIPSRPHGHLAACVRLGVCSKGCPEGAKAVADKAYWIDATASGARLITGARVREITTDSAGLATGAIWIDRSGEEHHQRARVVILCANGIGTARLLLLSKSARFPDGLANSSGLVGRNFMPHPISVAVGVFDEQLESWIGPGGIAIYSMQFYETDRLRGFVRGAKWSLSTGGGPLSIHPGLGRASLERGWGAAAHQKMRRLGHSLSWAICGETLPDPENRITLHDELSDCDGVPSVKVHFRVGENDRALRDWHIERARESLVAAGAVETLSIPVLPNSGGHMLGTARMGNDPATSVTDRWGRTHDVPNLYIFDGSLFVTSGGVNPTATICALAARGARHLIAARRDQKVAA